MYRDLRVQLVTCTIYCSDVNRVLFIVCYISTLDSRKLGELLDVYKRQVLDIDGLLERGSS